MTDDQIRSLCARLQSGEASAVEEMCVYITAHLHPLAHKVLRLDFPRVGLQVETDDIVHDVILKVIPYLRRGGSEFCEGVGPFHNLTATVLRRTLIGLARKYYGSLRSRPIGAEIEAEHPGLQEPDGLDGWRDRLRIHELIEKLDDDQRRVIELAIYLHFHNRQIAECLRVSEGTASRHLAAAKERLGQLLREDDAGRS